MKCFFDRFRFLSENVAVAVAFVLVCAVQVQAQNRGCKVVTDTIYSKILNAPRAYTVVLPGSFDADKSKHYPILYLLHGMWENNAVWVNRGHVSEVMNRLLASGEADEMVIVTPDAGGGDPHVVQNGYFDMPGWKYESFFFEEFVPHIEKLYRAGGSKGKRAVAGLSMGGGGATSYGQRHSNMFCGVYAMSALMSIPAYDMSNVSLTDKMGILTRSVIELSCTRYVEEADNLRKDSLRTVAWFVDCGDDDFLFDRNIEFFQAMRKAGIHCELRVRDGGHDYEYWHSALYTCLPFVSRLFIKNAAR